jgi:hypothetical protein
MGLSSKQSAAIGSGAIVYPRASLGAAFQRHSVAGVAGSLTLANLATIVIGEAENANIAL